MLIDSKTHFLDKNNFSLPAAVAENKYHSFKLNCRTLETIGVDCGIRRTLEESGCVVELDKVDIKDLLDTRKLHNKSDHRMLLDLKNGLGFYIPQKTNIPQPILNQYDQMKFLFDSQTFYAGKYEHSFEFEVLKNENGSSYIAFIFPEDGELIPFNQCDAEEIERMESALKENNFEHLKSHELHLLKVTRVKIQISYLLSPGC